LSTHNLIVPIDVEHNLDALHSAVMLTNHCIYGNGTYVNGAYGNGRVQSKLEIKQSQHEAHRCCSN